MRYRRGLTLKAAAWLLLGLLAEPAIAREFRWTHFGLRPLGMGNAYVAVADDYNALFYNPAGLARLKTWDGEFLNPTLEVAQHTYQTVNNLMKLGSGTGGDLSEVLDTFQSQSGKVHHFAYYQTPHLLFPHVGFGVGFDFSAALVPHSDIDIEFAAGTRFIAPLSFAMNLLEDRLSLGASVKLLARGGIDRNFTLQSISAFSKKSDKTAAGETSKQSLDDYVDGGYGMGVDVGMLFTPIEPMQPTLGVSITDLGGSTYKKADIGGTAIGTPKARLPAVNTGVSIKPWQQDRMYVMVAADAHMINQPIHYSHKLNLGLEWGYGGLIKVQTGLKEGYITAGFQFDVGLLNLRFATYAVDHGPVVGLHENLVQRRFALQLKLLI